MAVGTAAAKQANIALIRKTENDYYAEGSAGTTNSTSGTTVVSLDTDIVGTSDYLIFATCSLDGSNTSYTMTGYLYDFNTDQTLITYSFYPSDITDIAPHFLMTRMTSQSGTLNLGYIVASQSTLNTITYRNPTIFALNLSQFSNYYFSSSTTASTTNSTTFQDKVTLTQTTNNLRHLVFSYALINRNINDGAVEAQNTLDGVEMAKSYFNPDLVAGDFKAHFSVFSHYPTNESHTYKIQYRSPPGTSNGRITQAQLCVIEYNDNSALNLNGNLSVLGNTRIA